MSYAVLPTVSSGYPPPKGRLPTCSSPVRHVSHPKMTPCDLHALGTPPALILSQDQTLHQLCWHPRAGDPDREIHQPPAMPVVSVLTRGLVTSHHQLRSPGSGQPAPASSRVLARLQSPQDSRPQKDRAFGFASSSAHKPNLLRSNLSCAHLLRCEPLTHL